MKVSNLLNCFSWEHITPHEPERECSVCSIHVTGIEQPHIRTSKGSKVTAKLYVKALRKR